MYTLVSALAEEIQFLKRTRIHSTYTLFDGYLVSTSSDFKNDEELICSGYYRFENKQLLTLASNTGALFTINGTKYKGFIEYCDRFAIEVSIDDFHAYTIDSVSVEIESWRLLEIQSNRLSEIKEDKIVRALQSEHYHPAKEVSDYIYGQEQSIKHAKENEISVIWGPPGTGKTYTLAKIALNEARAGKRVLILSQSNMAVDSAILQLKKAVGRNNQENYKTHLFLRYGMARSPELLEYPEFLSWDVAINSNIKNRNEYESLLELSKSKNLSDEKLNEIKTKRAELISRIAKEELEIINNTKIVAMTATKATINKDISRQNWDTVIFDEISMAYISQVMIAGSLAKKKLVLIGDFKQLAPIVQNDNPNSLLRKDIFSYLNIVSNGTVRKHKWLVMLNTQWRMHTEIAEFANKYIYDGKLRTAGDSVYDTALIASKGPFNNKVFTYVDYSAYQGTCYSTQYGSRFQYLSALL